MLLTDRQTKRQTYRHRRNHNLLGGGNDDYLLRRHSTAARILRSLSQCVWGVFVCVSTVKRKPLIGMTWNLAQKQSSTVCRSPLILDSKGQGSGAQGHHLEILTPPSYPWNGCRYKVQILCTNALRAVIVCGSKIMPECGGCHGI